MPGEINANVLAPGTVNAHVFGGGGNLIVELPPPFGGTIGATLPFLWREYISTDKGCTQSYSWGNDSTQFSYTIDCLWTDFINGNAILNILGYSQPDRSTVPFRLKRIPPWRHPAFPDLVATRITNVEGMQFLGRMAAAPIAYYRLARITILFQKVPYRTVDDATLSTIYSNKEYRRWTLKKSKGSGEFLTRQPGSYLWAQGPSAGQNAHVAVGQYIAKEMIQLIWYDVPASALIGSSPQFQSLEKRPANQYDGIGKVNNATFFGYPKETLLLDSVELQERLQPVPAVFTGLSALEPALAYDVVFNVLYLDPSAVDNNVARGHNLVPQPQQGPWVLVTDNGTVAGKRLYDAYDYEKLFTPNPA